MLAVVVEPLFHGRITDTMSLLVLKAEQEKTNNTTQQHIYIIADGGYDLDHADDSYREVDYEDEQ